MNSSTAIADSPLLRVNRERDRRDSKFELLGSKFRKPRTLPSLARPAFPASLARI